MSGLSNHALELTGLAGDPCSAVHRLDPRAKIIGLLGVTILAVSTPLAHWPVFLACVAVLAAYASVARVRPGALWRRVRLVLPLVLLAGVLLPFVRSGGDALEIGPLTVHTAGLVIFATLAAKATIGTLSAALLSATTTFPAVLRGLEAMRVPRLLVLIAAFMYRYLFVIAGEAGRMRAALLSRGYRPRHALHAGPRGAWRPRFSCAPTRAASASTWRCWRAATAARCRSSCRCRSAAPTPPSSRSCCSQFCPCE